MKCIRTSRACQRSTLALVARPAPSKYPRVSCTTRSSSVRSASFEGDDVLISRLPSALLLEEEIDVVRRDQIGRGPAVEIVLRHALLRESLDALLRLVIPAPRVLLIRRVEVGVGAERRQEGGLVIRRAAHPAIAET